MKGIRLMRLNRARRSSLSTLQAYRSEMVIECCCSTAALTSLAVINPYFDDNRFSDWASVALSFIRRELSLMAAESSQYGSFLLDATRRDTSCLLILNLIDACS